MLMTMTKSGGINQNFSKNQQKPLLHRTKSDFCQDNPTAGMCKS